MDCSSSGSSVHEISQAGKLERVAVSYSRGSSRPRNQTLFSFIAGRFFIDEPIWEKPLEIWSEGAIPSWWCWIETGSGFGSEGQELSEASRLPGDSDPSNVSSCCPMIWRPSSDLPSWPLTMLVSSQGPVLLLPLPSRDTLITVTHAHHPLLCPTPSWPSSPAQAGSLALWSALFGLLFPKLPRWH